MTNPNEPVYPIQDCNLQFIPGLTKREYFAAMSMQGLCADPQRSGKHEHYAEDAVRFADALIEALNKEVRK